MAPSALRATSKFAPRQASSATFDQRSLRADPCTAFSRRARPHQLARLAPTRATLFSLAKFLIARQPLRMVQPIRVAMWSGPRNISTAMMRAWGNREDTVVIDEPFYTYYLKVTAIEHPG